MADVYGHRWVSSYGADPAAGAGQTWARGLAGINAVQLARGVERCIAGAFAWPPTLPEFRALCLGVPPFAAVRADVGRADAFTRLVWQHLDGYRFKQASADQADRLLREAYELAREHLMRGGALPAAPKAAIAEGKRDFKPADPAVAQAAIAACGALLMGQDAAEQVGRDE